MSGSARGREQADTSAAILVTGAGGTIGSEVLRLVVGRARVRALVRSELAAHTLARRHPTLEVTCGDLANRDTLGKAFAGVDRMLLLAPSVAEQQLLEDNALDAALAAGVDRIVYLSNREVVWGIELGRAHAAIEARLARSGIAHVSLRPDYLLDNLLGELEALIAGWLIAPSGQGRCALIDARDVGSVAATALLAAKPPAGPLVLTGPESLTFAQLAARLGDSLGWRIEHLDPKPGDWSRGTIAAGLSPWLAAALREYFERLPGETAQPTGDVQRITGDRPRRIEDFARDKLVPALQRVRAERGSAPHAPTPSQTRQRARAHDTGSNAECLTQA